MNVNDLIEVLEKWDGDMPVCVEQSDGTALLIQSADWADHNSQGPVILLSPFASLVESSDLRRGTEEWFAAFPELDATGDNVPFAGEVLPWAA